MSTRKIKDAVNHGTGELIYFKSHAQATFMSDGSTVEDTINNIDSKLDLSDYVTNDKLEEYAKTEDIPSLNGYATQNWVENQGYVNQEDLLNISFNDIQGSPIIDDASGEFNILDENGNVGIKLNSDGLYVKDVITEEHVLSNKLDVNVFNNTVDNLYSKSDITITGKTLYIK